jgi:hypothetical protein
MTALEAVLADVNEEVADRQPVSFPEYGVDIWENRRRKKNGKITGT